MRIGAAMRSRLRVAGLVVAAGWTIAIGLTGCAASLQQEMAGAQQAIATAKSANADRYASELLEEASASLNEAMQLGGGQQREARELLERAHLQAGVASALAAERATAEQLQTIRERRDAAKTEAEAAKQAAEAAEAEVGKPISRSTPSSSPASPPEPMPMPSTPPVPQ